jgi:hypothetical protein
MSSINEITTQSSGSTIATSMSAAANGVNDTINSSSTGSSSTNTMFRFADTNATYSLSSSQFASPLIDSHGDIDRAVSIAYVSPSPIVGPSPVVPLPNKTLTFTGTTTATTNNDNLLAGIGLLPVGMGNNITKSLADLQLHSVAVPATTEVVEAAPAAPRFLDTFTTFSVTRGDLVASSTSPLLSWLRTAHVAITPSRSCRHRVHCTLPTSNANVMAAVQFRVNAFTANGGHIIEVQRRRGDVVQLSTLYRALVTAMSSLGLTVASSTAPVAPTLASLSGSLSLPSFITLPSIVMPLPTSTSTVMVSSPTSAATANTNNSNGTCNGMNADASLVASLQVQLSSTCSDIRREALQTLLSLSSSAHNLRYLTNAALIGQLTTLITTATGTAASVHDQRDAAALLSVLFKK